MSVEDIRPTTEEVKNLLFNTLRHCCRVEYYFTIHDVAKNDPQRPHDITKKGSKYSIPVLMGLALQDRNDDPLFFEKYVLPSIKEHQRLQYHHRKWNRQNPHSTNDDLLAGGIDTICSIIDYRKYNGGAHPLNEVLQFIRTKESHQIKWILQAYEMIKGDPEPNIQSITSLENIPDVGVSLYNDIVKKTHDIVTLLRKNYGYSDL
jgi:hypothetical protein